MRYVARYALLFALCLSGTSMFAAAVTVSDPLGLETQHPRLSWMIHSSERGEKQTAYQVLAATSLEQLQAGKA